MSEQLPVVLASAAGAAVIVFTVLWARRSAAKRPVDGASEPASRHQLGGDASLSAPDVARDVTSAASQVGQLDQSQVEPPEEPSEASQPGTPRDTELESLNQPILDPARVESFQEPTPIADVAATHQELAQTSAQTDASLPEDASPVTRDDDVTELTSAPAQGRMRGLLQRLTRSKSAVGDTLTGLLDAAAVDWESVEDTLIMADFGVRPASELVSRLKQAASRNTHHAHARELLRTELLAAVASPAARALELVSPATTQHPQVVVVVGVNGTGKTTTTGKLARLLKLQGYSVVLAAADTFRAAAAEQLATWGERVAAPVVRGSAGADPASVAFDALRVATEQRADVLLVDTAGRLHTKTGLMDELGKVIRILERQQPVTEVLLVLDATTGQNGLTQAKVFAEVAPVSGVVLTKLDGTAKGGIVVAVQSELGVPVKFVGLGEGPDDLADFNEADFVDALVGN